MKTILILCAVILIGAAVGFYQFTRMPNRYGAFTGAPKAEVSDLIKNPKGFLKKTVALEGVIQDQCEAMGCYFYFPDGNKTLRVDLQDIAMNAPRKNGHTALVEGQIVKYGDGYQLAATAVEFK
jgi:hypothetical protein